MEAEGSHKIGLGSKKMCLCKDKTRRFVQSWNLTVFRWSGAGADRESKPRLAPRVRCPSDLQIFNLGERPACWAQTAFDSVRSGLVLSIN